MWWVLGAYNDHFIANLQPIVRASVK